MTSELPSGIVAEICFIGRGGGAVKRLGGFNKTRHTIPDAANATTNAFLGKLCTVELETEAEQLFQAIRGALGYKRKEISLSVTSPLAAIMAKDFAVEILYGLEERDPGSYAVTTTLRGLRDASLARTEPFARVFAAKFSEISFMLKKGARVEAIIDTIEALDGEGGLAVDYPSDCRECVIRVDGIDAQVRCGGASLEMVFPRAAGPAELIDAFAGMRGAFAVAKPLSGLIG
jgi:hypothetical protein